VGDSPDTVTAKLFAGLELKTRERRATCGFSPAETPSVGALKARLGLELGAAGITLVNGVHASDDTALGPGDEVSLFPPLGGG